MPCCHSAGMMALPVEPKQLHTYSLISDGRCRALYRPIHLRGVKHTWPLPTIQMAPPTCNRVHRSPASSGCKRYGLCRGADSSSSTCNRVILHVYPCPFPTCNEYHTTLQWVLTERLIR